MSLWAIAMAIAMTQVLPLQNGVDGAGKVRQMVSGWGRGHPLVGWCNIVAAIQVGLRRLRVQGLGWKCKHETW